MRYTSHSISMKQIILYSFLLFLPIMTIAQELTRDSSQTLTEVTVTAFEQQRRKIDAPSSAAVILLTQTDRVNKTSLVNGLNTVSGVRMEERSPGSYRLNIRGSSLRSPFGVRNIKIYWNDIPVTDAGGNTYFNQFVLNNISTIEINKGPAGSLYGAGTGGLMLLRSLDKTPKPLLSLDYTTGSFGLQNLLASVGFGKEGSQGLLTYSHSAGDGYRDHTATRKDNLSFVTRIAAHSKQTILASVLYNSINYETPGGLTAAEFASNPRQSRPAAGGFPSATGAKAAIDQKNFLAGISHQYQFTEKFRNTTVLFGSFAQIKNPTFRNYERRNEPGFGARTTFAYQHDWSGQKLQLVAGSEWQLGFFNTQVSKNKNGNPDTLQTNDDINLTTYNFFAQADFETSSHWLFSAGASLNKSKVEFARLNKYPVLRQQRTYQNEISPRLSVVKRLSSVLSLSGTISKGFSPPTIAELLPSTGNISTFLEAEHGVNYEVGARSILWGGRLQADLSAFYFKLKNALVVRKDSANADYYINAGEATQKGIELSLDYLENFHSAILQQFRIFTAQTLNNFKYGDFQKDAVNYSGKKLPSVPDYTVSVLADLTFAEGIYLNSSFFHASSIYLNDANTVKAKSYDLVGARLGWKFNAGSKSRLNIYAGADNLLDQLYSLGNDINAAGGRYFNAAPGRNWYAGVSVAIK